MTSPEAMAQATTDSSPRHNPEHWRFEYWAQAVARAKLLGPDFQPFLLRDSWISVRVRPAKADGRSLEEITALQRAMFPDWPQHRRL